MTDGRATISFAYSGDQRRRLIAVFDPRVTRRFLLAWTILAVLHVALAVTYALRGNAVMSAADALFALAFAGIAVSGYVRGSAMSVAASGALRLTGDGLAGEVDGAPVSIPWSAIRVARDTGDAIVISARRRVIALPKDGTYDAAAVWAELEDRLLSKRGLVRGTRPIAYIVNAASPRGTDTRA